MTAILGDGNDDGRSPRPPRCPLQLASRQVLRMHAARSSVFNHCRFSWFREEHVDMMRHVSNASNADIC